MTAENFVKSIERYYGTYPNDFVRKSVGRYISRFDEGEIGAVQEMVLLYFSSQYGKTPDVAAIRQIQDEHKTEILKHSNRIWETDGEVFCGDRQIGHYDGDIFIPLLADLQGISLLMEYVEEFKALSATPEAFVRFLRQRNLLEAPQEAVLIEDQREE